MAEYARRIWPSARRSRPPDPLRRRDERHRIGREPDGHLLPLGEEAPGHGIRHRHEVCNGPRLPVIYRVAAQIDRPANPALRRAIADYLARERVYVQAAAEELAAATPFRKDLVEQD